MRTMRVLVLMIVTVVVVAMITPVAATNVIKLFIYLFGLKTKHNNKKIIIFSLYGQYPWHGHLSNHPTLSPYIHRLSIPQHIPFSSLVHQVEIIF